MTQKYQVKVSMKQAAIVETGIVLKQGDFGMQIEIEVLDFDVTGTTPQIVFRKAMGAVESTTITVSSNKYTYTFKGTELDTPGKVFCDLKLKNSTTQRISTASFMFKVVADTMDGLAEESSSYSDTIEQIVGGFDGAINELWGGLDQTLLQPLAPEDITAQNGYYSWDGFHSGNFTAAEYICTPGEKVLLTCSGNSAFAGFYVYNSNGSKIAQGTANKKFVNFEYLVPANAAKIGLNLLSGTEGHVDTLAVNKATTDNPYYISEIDAAITEINANITAINEDIDDIDDDVTEINTELSQTLFQPTANETTTAKQGYYDNSGFHSGSFTAAEYVCTPGDTILLTCSGNSAFAGFYVYNSQNAKIDSGAVNTNFVNYKYKVPENAATIGLNLLSGTQGRVDELVVKKPTSSNPFLIDSVLSNIDEMGKSITISLNSLHQDLADIELRGGRWGNDTYTSDRDYRTVVVPLEGLKSISISLTPTAAYTNPYTFVNDQFESIAHAARAESEVNYNVTLNSTNFPSGATKICITFKGNNMSATLQTWPNFYHYKKGQFEIEPIILRKFAYVGSGRSEGDDFCCSAFYIKGLNRIRIDAATDQYMNLYTFLDDGLGIISYFQYQTASTASIVLDVPQNGCWVVVSNRDTNIDTSTLYAVWDDDADACKLIGSKYYGKKIVWLGTSIPAGGYFGYNSPISYPALVGSKIGAYVINEAVGSSDIHCRIPNRVSAENPYGFEKNFESASRCLSNSITMMEWIIANYNSGVFTLNVPSSISTDLALRIKRCSYENKIDRYLEEGCEPDYWVLDHGRNDDMSFENDFDESTKLAGTISNNGYSHGAIVVGDGKTVSFDVSGLDIVYIDYLTTIYYDYWDLLDENNNVISYSSGVAYDNDLHIQTFLDVSNATTLCISTKKTDSVIVNSQAARLSTFYYQGAMNFIINRIKEYNPKSRIVMIGHYENQKYTQVCENQEKVSEYWSIPLMKLWEILGWSQKVVKTTGGWENGYWDDDANPSGVYMTELDIALPDGLHPHTDLSGNTLRFEANHIVEWFKQFIKYNE